jgi:alpha-L-rhamnosidase
MNSFNHYSFGAVGAWMYDHSLGIQRDENHPAFKHFILRPEPDPTEKMTYAKGYYDSMYGRIESCWSINKNCYLYNFTIPANTSATLELKAHSINNIIENNKSFKLSKGVKFIKEKDGKFIFELQPGTYNIQVTK